MLRYRQYQAVNIMVPLQDPGDISSSALSSHVQSKYRCARNDRVEAKKSCNESLPVVHFVLPTNPTNVCLYVEGISPQPIILSALYLAFVS